MNLGSMWNNNLKNSNKKFRSNNTNRKLIFNNIQNSQVVVKK